jgi:predicted CxxxxCH...CXXCH cytochrome family protein
MHANGVKDVVFANQPANYIGGAFSATFNQSDATCTNSCHTNGLGAPSTTTPKWTDASTGACGTCHAAVPTTTLHPLHFSTTGIGPKLGPAPDCSNCHDRSAGKHPNGVIDLKPGNSCDPCHPAVNGTPVWASTAIVTCESCHTVKASYVRSQFAGYTAPLKSATGGHKQYSSATVNRVGCTSCHDASADHIAAAPTQKRLLITGNALCSSCHTSVKMGLASTARANMLTHSISINASGKNVFTTYSTLNDFRARDCAGCHDTHGTTNYMSVRTIVAGVTIRPITQATLSTALRVASPTNGVYNGLCQVCHTKTKYFTRNAAPDLTHNGGHNCLGCHTHKGGAFAFKPVNGGCGGCHGYPPVNLATLTRLPGTIGTHGNYSSAKPQDYIGGGGSHAVAGHIPKTATADAGKSLCYSCHYNTFENNTHQQGPTPPTSNFVNVVVDPQYKFNNLSTIRYQGNTCSNVSCHFKASPNWVTGN